MMNIATRKAKLEATLSMIAGRAVELTIRSSHAFTWSMEGSQPGAAERLADFARKSRRATVTWVADAETGTHVYIEATL